MANLLQRYLAGQIRTDLERKMVFVSGPRQVGKTTLARGLLPAPAGYLSWDIPDHRDAILRGRLPDTPMLVFDELHKFRGWRGFLKGLYDRQDRTRILVTGSGRLDYYRYGGDSLQGRYHLLRLHPLSVAELGVADAAGLRRLLDLGAFPEPWVGDSLEAARRWSREYRMRLVEEEIRDLEGVPDVSAIELLAVRLTDLVGSPLSVNALREDLQVSHGAVSRWLEILERLYAIFRVKPFGAPPLRAVKKAQKHYHYDWIQVRDRAARFENLVAMHLLKWVHHEQDVRGRDLDLRYFRDVDGREVDFVVTDREAPLHLIEVKWSDRPVDKALRYLHARFPDAAATQISAAGTDDYRTPDGIRVQPAIPFLGSLV